jgi:replicative DNA helicase
MFLGSVSYNLSTAEIPHLFIALETPGAEIEQRNAGRYGNFNSIRFLTRDDPRLANRVADYTTIRGDFVVYEDAPGASFDQVRSMVTRHAAKGQIKGVVLDYLQLVAGKSSRDTEEYHLRSVAQWLADVARKEGLFVLVAAQVNQDGNTRGGEGLRLACDQYYNLHRDTAGIDAWMEMGESRYTPYQNIGSETEPGLILDKHGPHFRDANG